MRSVDRIHIGDDLNVVTMSGRMTLLQTDPKQQFNGKRFPILVHIEYANGKKAVYSFRPTRKDYLADKEHADAVLKTVKFRLADKARVLKIIFTKPAVKTFSFVSKESKDAE